MNIYVEALTGTRLRMTVAPFEKVISLKARIMRHEGVPIDSQHLIYNDKELSNDQSLEEVSVRPDATLRLVVSLRGGPVSTVSVSEEEVMEPTSQHKKDLTLIILDGNSSMRIVRLINENDDRSNTIGRPIHTSERLTNRSQESPPKLMTTNSSTNTGHQSANTGDTLREKLSLLQLKMDRLRLHRRLAGHPSSPGQSGDSSELLLKKGPGPTVPSLRRPTLTRSQSYDPKKLGQHVSSTTLIGGRMINTLPTPLHKSLSLNQSRFSHTLSRLDLLQSQLSSPNSVLTSNDPHSPSSPVRGNPFQLLKRWSQAPGLPALEERPQGHPSGTKKTQPHRCPVCKKKIGPATSFECRCGNTYCSKHRYPEEHTCSYNYRTDGRKTIRDDNPVVKALKLPHI